MIANRMGKKIQGLDLPDCSLKNVLLDKSLSDKTFIVEGIPLKINLFSTGREIRAHKVVLCARSEYFRRLFLSGMREAVEEVTDLTPTGVTFEVFSSLIGTPL